MWRVVVRKLYSGNGWKAFTKAVRKQQVKNLFNGNRHQRELQKESLAPKALAATVAGGL